ncbi:hypothetical protein [Alkalibaculum bacchi]|uniref:hypothetical protein n=1 Tax=Alkalibaculum bacchi TaxID=645887 RepID=UPI0026EBFA9D|nr:hypothetical protein [Alkalibaculum bacchi]
MRKLTTAIILVALALMFTGCGNNIVKKSIEQANTAIEGKDYDKALLALELALDEENDNVEANKLYSILQSYQKAKKAVDENKINEAKEILDDIDERYKNYPIKEDVNSLNNLIQEKVKEVEVINNNITKLEKLIEEKKYDEAKTLIEEINKSSLNEDQKNKINELDSKVTSEKAKAETESKKKATSNSSNNDNTSNSLTEAQAYDLILSVINLEKDYEIVYSGVITIESSSYIPSEARGKTAYMFYENHVPSGTSIADYYVDMERHVYKNTFSADGKCIKIH